MSLLLLLLSAITLLYLRTNAMTATVVLPAATLIGMACDGWHWVSVLIGIAVNIAALIVINPNTWRQKKLTKPLLGWIRHQLPKLSATEQQALNAGTVDWDGDIFSGKPNWQKLLSLPHVTLSPEEQAFLDGPTEQLCQMINDWTITNELYDLPTEVWAFIKQKGFFGLVIPKQYGGHGFSELAHSEIVMKVASRSITAAVTVMVPNSLGPAELLLHYGTDEQKRAYLPKLASGEHIPCFALTSPVAGSDAGSIPDLGVICEGEWQGKTVLGMKVTWNKRYITLAPVATLIGLAIKVYDPDNLLQKCQQDKPLCELGVTCVMIPHDTPGVNTGARHLPMNTAFMNGPTWGEDVFIPLDFVIGGPDMIGKGWMMLLEVLSIGRSISLPALSASAGKVACLTTGTYAAVREQFGRSISDFEGVQEAMEPIAGYTYMMDCARIFTAAMLERGVKPSVPSAVLKYRNTGLMRDVVNHAMDVVAGRGVINGPRNFLAPVYSAIPIAITVEGANILTRSLMVFGQGAIRCHPYIVREIDAANNSDEERGVAELDQVFYAHVAHSSSNAVRAFIAGLTRGLLESAPSQGGITSHYRQLNRFSALFSVLTDVALLTLGGRLKARQRFTGRMADAFSHQYYAAAVIKQWHEEGYPETQRELVEWSLQTSLYELEQALFAAVTQFPIAALRWPLRWVLFPSGRYRLPPDDKLGQRIAQTIVKEGTVRDRLIRGIYVNQQPDDSVGRILHSWHLAEQTRVVRQRIKDAIDAANPNEKRDITMLLAHEWSTILEWAEQHKVINSIEREQVAAAMTAIYDVIRVDAFAKEDIAARVKAQGKSLRDVERP